MPSIFYRHNLKSIFLLFKAVEHLILGTGNLLHLSLNGIQIATFLQTDFQIGEHSLLSEEIACEGYGGYDVVLVIFRLPYRESTPGELSESATKPSPGFDKSNCPSFFGA